MAANNQEDACKDTLRSSMRLIGFISCLLCFGIAGIAPVFVPFFLGHQYLPTVLLTIELSVVLIPMSISDVIQTQYLIPFKRDIIYIRSLFLGALLNLVLNLLLINPFGAPGVITATIVSNIAVMVYQVYCIREVYSYRQLAHAIGPFLVIGLLEYIAVFMIGKLSLAPLPLILIQLLTGVMTFVLFYLAYLEFFKRKEGGVRTLRQSGRWNLP